MKFKVKHYLLTLSIIFIIALIILGNVSCVEQSQDSDLEELEARIASQAEQIANFPAYTEVIEITEDAVTIAVHGAGDYLVMVTVYGSSLNDGKTKVIGDNCIINAEYQGSSSVLHIAVMPLTNWQKTDTIKLDVKELTTAGDIHCISAVIGVR